MSRINDALKRISENDKGASGPPRPPPGSAPEPSRQKPWFPIALLLFILILGSMPLWIYLRAAVNRPPPQVSESPPAPVAKFSAPMESSPPPSVVRAAPPIPPPSNTVAPATNAPPAFPSLKLQGIFYVAAHPEALVNGQTVGEGDSVAGVRIKQIAPDSVTTEWNGQAKVFHLKAP